MRLRLVAEVVVMTMVTDMIFTAMSPRAMPTVTVTKPRVTHVAIVVTTATAAIMATATGTKATAMMIIAMMATAMASRAAAAGIVMGRQASTPFWSVYSQ